MAVLDDLVTYYTADLSGLKEGTNAANKTTMLWAQQTEKTLRSVGSSFTRFGKTATLGLTAPIALVGAGLIKLASDAEETQNKFSVVFSSIADEADNAAEALADGYGLARTESKKLLSDTADLLSGFGFTQKASLDLSNQVQKLAVDLASFTNFSGGAEGASAALTKALLGERESVKSLGIAILEEDVKKEVAIMTTQGLTFETERQAKAYATLNIAMRQSKNAIGDFARSSDSFANQTRILKSNLIDLGTEIGQRLLPFANHLVGVLIDVTQWFNNLSPNVTNTVIAIGALAAAIGPVLLLLGGMASGISVLIGVAGTVATIFATALSPAIIGTTAVLGPLVAALGLVALAAVATTDAFEWDQIISEIKTVIGVFGEFVDFIVTGNQNISFSAQEMTVGIVKTWKKVQLQWIEAKRGYLELVSILRSVADPLAESWIEVTEQQEEANRQLKERAKVTEEIKKTMLGMTADVNRLSREIEKLETNPIPDAFKEIAADAEKAKAEIDKILGNVFDGIPNPEDAPGVQNKMDKLKDQISALVDGAQDYANNNPVKISIEPVFAGDFTPMLGEGFLDTAGITQMLGEQAQAATSGVPGQLGLRGAESFVTDTGLESGVGIGDRAFGTQGIESLLMSQEFQDELESSVSAFQEAEEKFKISSDNMARGIGNAFGQMLNGAKAFKQAFIGVIKSFIQQMIGEWVMGLVKQLALDKISAIGTAVRSAPHPFLIPAFVAFAVGAFAAAMSSSGGSQYAPGGGSAGGSGGGMTTVAATQTVAPVRQSEVITNPEPVETLMEAQIEIDDEQGNNLASLIVRKTRDGANDGTDRLVLASEVG
jgi:hypothetical protein